MKLPNWNSYESILTKQPYEKLAQLFEADVFCILHFFFQILNLSHRNFQEKTEANSSKALHAPPLKSPAKINVFFGIQREQKRSTV